MVKMVERNHKKNLKTNVKKQLVSQRMFVL